MDHFVLLVSLVEVGIDHLSFKQTAKQNRRVCLFKLLVISKLGLPVIAPDKESLLFGNRTRVDNTCRDLRHISIELHLLCICEVSQIVRAKPKLTLASSAPTVYLTVL